MGEIHFDGEMVEPLFDAIKAAPFSDSLKALLIDEILTSPGLRCDAPGFPGLFDGSDIITLDTGDASIREKLTGPGELMLAAFRALCSPNERNQITP